MNERLAIRDLPGITELDDNSQRQVHGGAVSSGYLFMSSPGARPSSLVNNQFFNIETIEVNNYETNNYIDKLINQTVNNNQLNLVSVQAGDAEVNVNVNQAQAGSNALG